MLRDIVYRDLVKTDEIVLIDLVIARKTASLSGQPFLVTGLPVAPA